MDQNPTATHPKGNKRSKPRVKHTPIRTCVACHRKDAKREYVRLVRSPEGEVLVDPSGKANGRGAYLCASRTCWGDALERNAISSSLKVKMSEEDRARLWEYARTHFPPEVED